MDPRNDLRIAEQRRAEFERRAAEHRYARSSHQRRATRRTWLTLPHTRRTAATAPATAFGCCPA